MEIRDAQEIILKFERARRWDLFKESQIFTHLIEEVSEIGRIILQREGYKFKGLGHEIKENDVSREFAQAFALFLQLANRMNVDLEEAFRREIEIMEKRFDADKWKRYMESEHAKA